MLIPRLRNHGALGGSGDLARLAVGDDVKNSSDEAKYKYLTPAAFAAQYGVSARTVRTWCDRGLVAHIRTPTGRILIDESTPFPQMAFKKKTDVADASDGECERMLDM